MSDVAFLAEELFKRYGTVKRARGPFLYTAKGVRLTDLYQEHGRAILGWDGGSAFTQLKNTLSRGIGGSFYTDCSYRLQKAVCDLLGEERIVLTFTDKKKMLALALSLAPENTSFYLPWAPASPDWSSVSAIAVQPPLPWSEELWLLALKRTKETEAALALMQESDALATSCIPAPIQAAATRSLYNLIKALQERSEKDWFAYDRVLCSYWTRKGPYLYPEVNKEKYTDFVLHCLDCGIVINPSYATSIVPFGADAGVFSKLLKNPFEGV
ncbi:MAG TPA: hypothetical protein DCQ43_06015 [Treponema sp.]|jgi:hypothetical protein|nr:hypothetical protein [Treponema sp.]